MEGNKNNKMRMSNKAFLDRIKETTSAKTVEFKFKKLNELTLNQKYLITNIEKTKNKFGDKLVMHLQYDGLKKKHEFRTYLPDRFLRLSNEDIEDLSSGDFYFIYNGKDKNDCHIIDFE